MFRIYPERLKGLIWIMNFVSSDALLVYGYAQRAWWTAGEERKRGNADEYQNS